jgi:hypothetical protein
LYGFVLVKCVYWLAWYDLWFGANAIAYTIPFDLGPVKNLAFCLYAMKSPSAGLYFILPLMALAAAGLFKLRIYFATDLFIWLLVVNIHHKVYPALTGGENLLNQLLFFNCFISLQKNLSSAFKDQVKLCLHNFGIVAILLQVCLVYFISAVAKLRDDDWLNGSAVATISRVQHFSLPLMYRSDPPDRLLIFLNYLVLTYQLLFPLLVWVNRLKKPLLLLGILMHLYIAFVMGLVTFGFVMILCYIYFWPRKSRV